MQDLQIFNSPEFGQIRTIERDGDPWFVGKDVAAALGYSDTKSALTDHIDSEDKQIIQRGQIATLDIPNRGLTIPARTALIAALPLTVTRLARDTFTESRLARRSEKKKRLNGRLFLNGMRHAFPS